MKKLAALLSATMMINSLAMTSYAFESVEEENLEIVVEATQTETNETQTDLEESVEEALEEALENLGEDFVEATEEEIETVDNSSYEEFTQSLRAELEIELMSFNEDDGSGDGSNDGDEDGSNDGEEGDGDEEEEDEEEAPFEMEDYVPGDGIIYSSTIDPNTIIQVQYLDVTYMKEVTVKLNDLTKYIPVPTSQEVKAVYLPGETLPFDADKYIYTSGSATNTFLAASDYANITPRYSILNYTSRNFGFDGCHGVFIWDTESTCWRYYCNGGGVKNLSVKLYETEAATATITTSNLAIKQVGVVYEDETGGYIDTDNLYITVNVNGQVMELTPSEYTIIDGVYNVHDDDYTITISYGGLFIDLDLVLTPDVYYTVYDGEGYVDTMHDIADIKYYYIDEDGKVTNEEIPYEERVIPGTTFEVVLTYKDKVNTQTVVITQRPISLIWDGGPYEYNSLEHVPTYTINYADLVKYLDNEEFDEVNVTGTTTKVVSLVGVSNLNTTSYSKRAGIEAGKHYISGVSVDNSYYILVDPGHYFDVTQKEIYATYTDVTAEYTGGALSPTIILHGVENDVDEVLDDVQGVPANSMTQVGSYTFDVALVGEQSNNYILISGLTGEFSIYRSDVVFDVPEQIVPAGSLVEVNPYDTDGNDLNIGFNVKFVDEDGNEFEGPYAPTDGGIYDVYVEIADDSNYKHAGTTTGGYVKVDSIYVVDSSTTDSQINKALVSLTFNENNGTTDRTVDDVLSVVSGTITTLPTPVREGYIFAGWEYNNKVYSAGEQFEITQNCTLKALWVKVGSSNTTGTLGQTSYEKDENGDIIGSTVTPVEGASVNLWDGDKVVGSGYTDADGNFDLGNEVLDGYYNLTIEKDGELVTTTVTIKNGEIVADNTSGGAGYVEFPVENKNSVVEIEPGMGSIIVGGVDNLASSNEGDGNFKVVIDDEISDEFAGALEEEFTSGGIVVDIEISKDGEVLDVADDFISVTVKLPTDSQKLNNYKVAVYDDETGEVTYLSTNPNEDGEYYELSSDRTTITIVTNKTETYVIDAYATANNGPITVTVPSQSGTGTDTGSGFGPEYDDVLTAPTMGESDIYGPSENDDDGVAGLPNNTGVDITPDEDGGFVAGNLGDVLPNEGKDIIIYGPTGEEIARYPITEGMSEVSLPDLGPDYITEGWYETVDSDGNLVFKPITTVPTMSEATLSNNANPSDATNGVDDGENDKDNDSDEDRENIGTFVPQTSDEVTYTLWFAMMLLSAAFMFLINRKRV